jgi:hypothetical protein
MLPRRDAFVTRACALAFGLVAILSVAHGAGGWTVATRGLLAAVATAVAAPLAWRALDRALRPAEPASSAAPKPAAAGPAGGSSPPR